MLVGGKQDVEKMASKKRKTEKLNFSKAHKTKKICIFVNKKC